MRELRVGPGKLDTATAQEDPGTPATVRYGSPYTPLRSPSPYGTPTQAPGRNGASTASLSSSPLQHSPATTHFSQPTQRASANAAENRRVVLERKLSRAKSAFQPWVVPDTTKWRVGAEEAFPGHRGMSRTAPLTPQEARRVPAGTYKQLEDKFFQDYSSVQQRLARVLDRCSTFQSNLTVQPPPEPWHQPYPAGSDIVAGTGDGLSPSAALEAAATLRGIATQMGEEAAALGRAGSRRPTTPTTSTTTTTRGHITTLLSEARGLHAGSLAYVSGSTPSTPGPRHASTLTAADSVLSTPKAGGFNTQANAAATPGALSSTQAGPFTPAGGLSFTPASPFTSAGQQQAAGGFSVDWAVGASQHLGLPATGLESRVWEPAPLTFKASTNKFLGGAITAAVQDVFRAAQSDSFMQGLSHRERLQAGVRELNAEFFGPLMPAAWTPYA